MDNPALAALRRNVTGRVESGEAEAIVEVRPEPQCVPLCGASKAYGPYVKWWQHEPLCPVRQAKEQTPNA